MGDCLCGLTPRFNYGNLLISLGKLLGSLDADEGTNTVGQREMTQGCLCPSLIVDQ